MNGGKLFLMEFLVDNVNVPAIRAIHEEILPTKTCVSFQILDLSPLDIYQESPTEACACSDNGQQIFKKGKSCLFALSNFILQKPLCNFPVRMSVYKEFPPGVLPDVMLIGSHQIQVCGLINCLLDQSGKTFKPNDISRTIKDTFKITTATGQCVGQVTVFIRVSCLGKKIVTQFQIPENEKPYLFKGVDDDSPIFQCRKITSTSDIQRIRCACPTKKTSDGSRKTDKMCCPCVTDEHRRKDWRGDAKCPPCCVATQDTIQRKETVKKCGCAAKEKRICNCARTNVKSAYKSHRC